MPASYVFLRQPDMSRGRHGRRDEQVLEVRLRGRVRSERVLGIGSSSSAWWSPYASPQIRPRKTAAAAQEEGRAYGAGRWGGRAGVERSVDVHACAVRVEVAWEDVQAVHALMGDIRDATAALQTLPAAAGATTLASRRCGSHGPYALSSRAMSDSPSPLGRALGSPAVAYRDSPPHAAPGVYVSCECVCVCVCVCVLVKSRNV